MKINKALKTLMSSLVLFSVVGCGMLRGNNGELNSNDNSISYNKDNSVASNKESTKSSSKASKNSSVPTVSSSDESQGVITVNEIYFIPTGVYMSAFHIVGEFENCNAFSFAVSIRHKISGVYIFGDGTYKNAKTKFSPSRYFGKSFEMDISLNALLLKPGTFDVEFVAYGTSNKALKVQFTSSFEDFGTDAYYEYSYTTSASSSSLELKVKSLLPFSLSKATLIKDLDDKIWLKMGGKITNHFFVNDFPSFVSYYRAGSNVSQYGLDRLRNQYQYKIENDEAYVYIDVTLSNSYETYYVNFDYLYNESTPCKMENPIDADYFFKTSGIRLNNFRLTYLPIYGSVTEGDASCYLKIDISPAETGATETPSVDYRVIPPEQNILDDVSYDTISLLTIDNIPVLRVSGSFRGTINEYNSKFAFGIQTITASGYTGEFPYWLYGEENPDVSDYNLIPSINGQDFTISIILSNIKFYVGQYYFWAGPISLYMAFLPISGQYNVGEKIKVNGGIASFTEEGLLLIEEEAPFELNDTFLRIEDGSIYHYIGGTINISEDEFLSVEPSVDVETTVGSWRRTYISKDSNNLQKVIINGKGYIKYKLPMLTANKYIVHASFNNDPTRDLIFDNYINTSNDAIVLDGLRYYLFANKAGGYVKDNIYEALGIIVENVEE